MESRIRSEKFLREIVSIKSFDETGIIMVGELGGRKAIALITKNNGSLKAVINYIEN
jgi:hypothetical protein